MALNVKVRAVVVTWNGAHLLPRCLNSLLAQNLPPGALEILVVDNASSDNTAMLLANDYPQVQVLSLPENRGFAGGMAAGTADLLVETPDEPKFVALLNNDAQFEPDALSQMIAAMDAAETKRERIGAVTALVLLDQAEPRTDNAVVQSTGNILTRSGAAADRDFGTLFSALTPQREVFGFNGGAALIRTTALRAAGGFDADLFLYYEDTDLSWKMRKLGWSIIFEPRARAWHQHMASTGGAENPVFRFYNTRNSVVVVRRHAGWWAAAKSFSRQLLGTILRTLRAPLAVTRTEPWPVTRARWRGLLAATICRRVNVARPSR